MTRPRVLVVTQNSHERVAAVMVRSHGPTVARSLLKDAAVTAAKRGNFAAANELQRIARAVDLFS